MILGRREETGERGGKGQRGEKERGEGEGKGGKDQIRVEKTKFKLLPTPPPALSSSFINPPNSTWPQHVTCQCQFPHKPTCFSKKRKLFNIFLYLQGG